MTNKCTHEINRGGFKEVRNSWTGEYETEWVDDIRSAYKDINLGSCKCTECGHILYYSESWRKALGG